MNQMVKVALGYRKQGFSVIPIEPKGKTPIVHWKPFQERKATRKEIKSWWKDYPKANIGIVTGSVLGIVVIDCDSNKAARDFEKAHPEAKNTLQVVTGRGKHFYFRCRRRNPK